MKKILHFSCFAMLLILLLGVVDLNSQQFTVAQVNTFEFPKLSANFMAKDAQGNSYKDLDRTNFAVFDAGKWIDPLKIDVDCYDTIVDPAVNIVLVIDRSGSMEDIDPNSGQMRWAWVKEGVRSFLNSIRFTNGTKVGMVTFDGLSKIACRFTDDKEELMDTLDAQYIAGGTNYNPPFLDEETGSIKFMVNYDPLFTRRRVVVFLTDGDPNSSKPTLTDEIKAECIANGIQVYGITLTLPMNKELDIICRATAGFSQAVYTKEELSKIYEYVALDIQKSQICKLSWISEFGCTDLSRYREAKITFKKDSYNKTLEQEYQAPENSVAKAELSESILSFDDPPPNGKVTADLVITARNSPLTIGTYTITPTGFFDVINWDVKNEYTQKVPPFTIEVDKSRTIRVEFTQGSDKLYRQATLNFVGSPCPPSIPLVGGYSKIRIVSPNGGEGYTTCDSVVIKWAGVSEETIVKLYYSTNNGVEWKLIADASGLSYVWTELPSSDKMLIKGVVSGESSWMWALRGGGVNYDKATSIAIQSNDLYLYTCGYFEGNAQFGTKTLQSSKDKDIFLFKVDTDGNIIEAASAGGPGIDTASGICVDPTNKFIYFTGVCYQGAQFGTMNPPIPLAGQPYCFVAKYSTNLTSSAVRYFGAPDAINPNFKTWGLKIRYNNNDKIEVLGEYTGKYNGPEGSLTEAKTTPRRFTAIYNPDDMQRISVSEGGAVYQNYSKDFCTDSKGNRYETGGFTNTKTFGSKSVTSAGSSDAYVAKYGTIPGSEDFSDAVFKIEAPKLEFTIPTYDFGNGMLGTPVDKQLYCLKNAGTLPIRILDWNFNPDINFSCLDLPEIILPGETIPINFRFLTEKDIGLLSTKFEVIGSCDVKAFMTLTGNGVCGGEVEELVDFGDVRVGTSKELTIECIFKNTNPLTVPVNLTKSGTNPNDFQLDNVSYMLEQGKCIDMTITFHPSTLGGKEAYIDYNLPEGCEKPKTRLIGNGIDPGFPSHPLDFGLHRILTLTDSFIVAKNETDVDIFLTKLDFSDETITVFSFINKPALPLKVPANDTIHIPIRFIPTEELDYANSIIVNIQNFTKTLEFPLTGSGFHPQIEAVFTCGESVPPGESSTGLLEVKNLSLKGKLFIQSIDFDIGNEYKWVVTPPSDFSIPSLETRVYTVTFTPGGYGVRTDDIVIKSDATTGPIDGEIIETIVPTNCEGLGVELESPFNFGNVIICDSYSKFLQISNLSAATNIEITNYTLQGGDNDPEVFNALIPANFSVKPGDTKKIEITFSPKVKKEYKTTMVLVNNQGLDLKVELVGTGVEPELSSPTTAIEAEPGEQQQLSIRTKIPQLPYIITDMEISVVFDPKMVMYKDNSFAGNPSLTNWTWQPPVKSVGMLVVNGSGTFTTPFDGELFSLGVGIYLGDQTESIIRLHTLLEPCLSSDFIAATIKLGKVCNVDGRLIIPSNTEYMLKTPEPNPARDNMTLSFGVGIEAPTTITIYNSVGTLVKTIVNESMKKGYYEINESLQNYSAGVYFIRMNSGPYTATRRLVITK